MNPQAVVTSFNDAITRQDIGVLNNLITDNHVFIDSTGGRTEGREAVVAAWKSFFDQFPGYVNIFADMQQPDETHVVIIGHSECSVPELAGPALWRATIDTDRIAMWEVFEDTPQSREYLHLSKELTSP